MQRRDATCCPQVVKSNLLPAVAVCNISTQVVLFESSARGASRKLLLWHSLRPCASLHVDLRERPAQRASCSLQVVFRKCSAQAPCTNCLAQAPCASCSTHFCNILCAIMLCAIACAMPLRKLLCVRRTLLCARVSAQVPLCEALRKFLCASTSLLHERFAQVALSKLRFFAGMSFGYYLRTAELRLSSLHFPTAGIKLVTAQFQEQLHDPQDNFPGPARKQQKKQTSQGATARPKNPRRGSRGHRRHLPRQSPQKVDPRAPKR